MSKFIIFFTLVVFSYAQSVPSWFMKLTPSENQIIGYGDGTTLEKAKEYALKEIANSISTKIESYLITHKKYDSKSGMSKQQESYFKQSTNVKIEDIQVIQSLFLNDKWYIAISYDYTPFALQFKELLAGMNLKNETQDPYWKKTNLVKNLNNIMGYKLNYDIYSKDGLWYLGYKDKSKKISQKEFSNLFAFVDSNSIELDTNKNKYTNNDTISFYINTKKKGYVTLLYLSSNGQVGLLKHNQPINGKYTYPEDGKIVLKKNNKDSNKFMVFAIYSAEKINLKKFEAVSKDKINNYDFSLLIQTLKNYQYTTYVGNIN